MRIFDLDPRPGAAGTFLSAFAVGHCLSHLLASCTSDANCRDVVLSGFFSSTRIFPHHAPNADLLRDGCALARLGSPICALRLRTCRQRGQAHAHRSRLVHEPQTLLFDELAMRSTIGADAIARHHARSWPKAFGHSSGHPPRFRNNIPEMTSSIATRRRIVADAKAGSADI